MILTAFRNRYQISHLYHDPKVQKLLQRYKQQKIKGPFNLPLKLMPAPPPTFLNKFLLDKPLSQKFLQTIQFISSCSNSNFNPLNHPNIQQNLQKKLISFIKQRPQQIIIHQCNVGRAYYLEETKIYGVFFHRKLNLHKSCYSVEFTKDKEIKYRLRGKLTNLQDQKQYQKAKNMYQEQGLAYVYMDTFQRFIQTQFIIRALVKVVADLKIQIVVPNLQNSIRLGYQGPTEHILQFQYVKIPYQEEKYAITDIDFFLQGNYHFLNNKN